VTAQRLDRILEAWRIGDPEGRFPIFDATGSALAPGRWNRAEGPVIYAARSYSTAMLEKLVHGAGRLPPNQHAVRIRIPPGVSFEAFDPAMAPGWAAADEAEAQAWGAAWRRQGRSAVLLVPSVVARVEENVVINPDHPDFPRIEHDLPRPVWWDRRLFG
jgi:RES domain-containing protein